MRRCSARAPRCPGACYRAEAGVGMSAEMAHPDGTAVDTEPAYDFGGATFDLDDPADRELVRFVLSQALYGEATGVYCGKSLYAAGSLEAARFYLRQARQELNHLELFADVFRL